MQIATFESSWPVLSAIKWDRQYHAMLATPLRVGDILLGHQAFVAARLPHDLDDLPRGHQRPSAG